MSRPVPVPVSQTSVGRLVSLTVDSPQYYTSNPPHLLPVSCVNNNNNNNDSGDAEEKTMLWRNVATLFAQFDNLESKCEEQYESTKRRSDELYGEIKCVWSEVESVQNSVADVDNTTCVRKIRKYVNKKCEQLKEDINYGSSCANDEIFAYIETLRSEFDTKIKNLQDENTRREQELSELNDTYNRDYDTFVQRENDLMAKLETAVKMNEAMNARFKHFEDAVMRQLDVRYNQIYTVRDELRHEMTERDIRLAGDMREEFARAITKEVEFESKTSAQLVQTVNDELTDLITRSNECHSYRYFGMVEEVKQVRDTLKKSIGMVDAELSDVKETVEQLTDEVGQHTTDISNVQVELDDLKKDVYYELDRDYYDLKDYVKRTNRRHEKKYHPRPQDDEEQTTNAVQLIAEEYAEQEEQQQPRQNEIFIIIDENTVVSEDDEQEDVMLRPQV
jgi:hypothetical protein